MYIKDINKIMSKTVFSICTLLITCLTCNAQAMIGVLQLNGTKWIRTYPENPEEVLRTMVFSETTINITSDYRIINDVVTNTYQYYLNDCIPSVFDFSKVGKASKGKYIICYNSRLNRIRCYEFICLEGDILTLHSRPDPNQVIGDKNGTELVYKRIK